MSWLSMTSSAGPDKDCAGNVKANGRGVSSMHFVI
jgi:hypothetical protein